MGGTPPYQVNMYTYKVTLSGAIALAYLIGAYEGCMQEFIHTVFIFLISSVALLPTRQAFSNPAVEEAERD